MQQLLELVIIVFLIVISIELLFIHRELARRSARGSAYNEEPLGQTINVNVGTPVAAAGSHGTVAPDRIDQQNVEAPILPSTDGIVLVKEPETAEFDAPPAEPEPSRPAAGIAYRATSSGLLAKKCPSCGMENSSMRSECFNCGISL